MTYESAAKFDRAAKRAARDSGKDAGQAYREMLRDRFLCRVFADENRRFILKGGSGLLARIPDARATRDIDFAISQHEDAEAVLASLEALVKQDLGDWCRFELTKRRESLDENGYSRLLKLRYASFVGDEEKDPILIDLSLDCSTTQPPELIRPASRIHIDGVETCDYLVYPLPDQLADKLCAIMELQPGGHPSSRMKDLVDVVTYTTHEPFSLAPLRRAIASECAKRGMVVPERFAAPETWKDRFNAYALGKLPDELADFEAASAIASSFFDPALGGAPVSAVNASWDLGARCWSRGFQGESEAGR